MSLDSSAASSTVLREFLEGYRRAWEEQRIDDFLTMYALPLQVLRLDGSLHCLHDEVGLRTFFTQALAGYVATGYSTAELVEDRIAQAGRTVAIVDVTWVLRSSPDKIVLQRPMTYNLVLRPEGWRVFSMIMHTT